MICNDAPVAVFGAGGFTRQILPTLDRLQHAGRQILIVDDRPLGPVFGYSVVPLDAVPVDAEFVIAVANGKTRQEIANRLSNRSQLSLIASTALISRHTIVGEGSVICDYVIIEAGCRIGRYFHGNIYSYVAHECVIGDYVTFAPRVACNGNVHIDDHAFIGSGAIIRQGTSDTPLRIGKRAVVGMGAVVTKDVPDDAVVVGNPARNL